MDFNIDFNLVRSQKLLLIPQLKQALEILEMSSQELVRHVEEQMEANPAIEIAVDNRTAVEYADESMEAFQPEDTQEILCLKDHLLLQLKAMDCDKLEGMVGEYLIDNTDENGYMNADIYEVASFFNISADRVCQVLENLQKFDPPGICARSLKECLLLQLDQMDELDTNAMSVVEKHLDKLASNDARAVSDILGIPLEETYNIFRKIRSLEPRPGREFFDRGGEGSLVADIIVKTINGRPEALINDEAFPEVGISSDFKPIQQRYADEEAGRLIQSCINNAVWLIKCMEQRKDIILKIAGKLIEYLPEFFEKGKGYLKPIDTYSFAERMEMHETILIKALTGKYLQCRWGVFELGHFLYDSEEDI